MYYNLTSKPQHFSPHYVEYREKAQNHTKCFELPAAPTHLQ